MDAGHGGRDPGNRGNGYYEKKIALNIALQIGKILSENPLFKVVYTRKKDVFVDLIERADIANKADADLFVSIHCDSHNSKAYGAGTFVLGLHANQRNFEIAKKENSVIFLVAVFVKSIFSGLFQYLLLCHKFSTYAGRLFRSKHSDCRFNSKGFCF